MSKFEGLKNSWEVIKKKDPIAAFIIRGLGFASVLMIAGAVAGNPEDQPEPEPNRYTQLAPKYDAEDLEPNDQVAFHRLATLTPQDVKAHLDSGNKNYLSFTMQLDLIRTSLGLLQNPDGPRYGIDEYSLFSDVIHPETQQALKDASIATEVVRPINCDNNGIYLNPRDFTNHTNNDLNFSIRSENNVLTIPLGGSQQSSLSPGIEDYPSLDRTPLEQLQTYECHERPVPVVWP